MRERSDLASFNLIREPWIPCLMAGGERISFGIREVLGNAHHVRDIEGDTPLVSAALHRLLIAIVHRNVEVDSVEAWAALWESEGLDIHAFDEYFRQWERRFDLFDPVRPFYQVSSLDRSVSTSSARLLFHQANNATLFSHLREDRPPALAPAVAARLLVSLMAFDFGGTKTGGSAKAAPLNRGAVVLAKGQNLFETLALNLCRYAPEEGKPWDFDRDGDMPAWERKAETVKGERSLDGYLDLLTWQSRRILLIPEEGDCGDIVVRMVTIKEGNRLAGKTLHGRETMMAFRRNLRAGAGHDPWPAIRFCEERALWRDSLALLHAAGHDTQIPATLRWLSDLAFEEIIPHSSIVPVDVYGLAGRQAKPLFWRHERLPLPVAYLSDPRLTDALRAALEIADIAGSELNAAIWLVASDIAGSPRRRLTGAPKKRVSQIALRLGADRVYWASLGLPFRRLIVDLPRDRSDSAGHEDAALDEWTRVVGTAMWGSFRRATGSLERSARNLGTLATAERRLRRAAGAWLHGDCGGMAHE